MSDADKALAGLAELQDAAQFQRQLELLNAHPERWAILVEYVHAFEMWRTGTVGVSQKGELIYRRIDDALKLFGLSINVYDARALLAARESEEGKRGGMISAKKTVLKICEYCCAVVEVRIPVSALENEVWCGKCPGRDKIYIDEEFRRPRESEAE